MHRESHEITRMGEELKMNTYIAEQVWGEEYLAQGHTHRTGKTHGPQVLCPHPVLFPSQNSAILTPASNPTSPCQLPAQNRLLLSGKCWSWEVGFLSLSSFPLMTHPCLYDCSISWLKAQEGSGSIALLSQVI